MDISQVWQSLSQGQGAVLAAMIIDGSGKRAPFFQAGGYSAAYENV